VLQVGQQLLNDGEVAAPARLVQGRLAGLEKMRANFLKEFLARNLKKFWGEI
jgi:hypothetical protein